MTSGWLDSARRVGLLQVAAELGVEVRRRALVRCPACGAESGVKVVGEGRWRCFHCDAGGDAVDLVSYAVHGRKLDRAGSEAVRDWYAARGWCEAPRDREIRRVEPRPAPERVEAHVEGPPPQDEVYALGRACRPVTEDAEVSAWLVGGPLDRDGAVELALAPGAAPPLLPIPRAVAPRTTSTPGLVPPGFVLLEARGGIVQMKRVG